MINKRLLFKLISLCGIPVLVFLGAELFLSFLDYKTTYEQEDPFLGFKSKTSLFEEKLAIGTSKERLFVTRDSKLPWFNYQEFEVKKPGNTYRIFCFGGSTTFGRPYKHNTAFSNWLQILLSASDPFTNYEVINVGGVSYASYRIINLMNEMINYEPDLFIVYTGHNEFLEERTYSDILEEPSVITHFRSQLHRLRTYSLARNLLMRAQQPSKKKAEQKFQMSGEVSAILDQSFGLEHYNRDTKKQKLILDHFRYNLDKMIDIVEGNNIRLVFIVPSSNEKDFTPFKSQLCDHLTGQTRRHWFRLFEEGLSKISQGDYNTALDFFYDSKAIDSCSADLRYQIGQAYLALGEYRAAKREFVYARDLDIVPLRATSEIQSIVREVANRRSVPIIDLALLLETAIQKSSGHTILGNEAFLDHVHPKIRVHQMLAEELAKTAFKENWIEPEKPIQQSRTLVLYDSIMVTLDTTYYATKDLNLAKVLSWLGKTQEAAPFVKRASEALPNHPEAQYLKGVFFQNSGEFPLAEESYKKAITLDSTFFRAYHALASVYEITEQWDKAIVVITHAVRYQPESADAYFSLGNSFHQTGQKSKAVEAYERALKFNPRHSKALNNLAAVHITEGNYDDAIKALEKTLELEPKNINAYKNLGLSHYHLGRYDQSWKMFETVLDLRPNDDYATQWLIRLYQERKK